jgi:hypothetical protein
MPVVVVAAAAIDAEGPGLVGSLVDWEKTVVVVVAAAAVDYFYWKKAIKAVESSRVVVVRHV